MLSYLFWHQPADNEQHQGYEQALVAFHRRLREVPVPGLLASGTARVRGLPWMPGAGYEDWYAVEDFSALGLLNDAAVDAAHAHAHDLVAHAAGFGAGGLYALERGETESAGGLCIWLTKPKGFSYPAFREQLAVHTANETVAVWRRQLVLGPAPEFRLVPARELALPAAMTPIMCRQAVVRTD